MNYVSNLDQYIATKLNFSTNFDVLRKVVDLIEEQVILYTINSLLDSLNINDLIFSLRTINRFNDIANQSFNASVSLTHDVDKAINQVYSGVTIIIKTTEENDIYIIETRKYPTRGVEEPSTEKSVRGSKDGFVENIITNVGLIRRRIKVENLLIKIFEVGDKSKTHVVLLYMSDSRFNHIAKEIEKILPTIKMNELVMSDRALVEGVFQQKLSHYPLVRYSERPDVVAINIIQGYIAIIVDTSPSVVLTPTTIFEHIEHVEEYRQTPLVGTFTRVFRLIAVLISLFLVPLWMVLVNETTFQGIFLFRPHGELTVPLLVQVLIVEVMIEVLRIATIHTPTQLSSAMGLVAALLLGQIAIEIGIFIPEVLLYGAISAMGGFATPSYELSLSNKITKILLIILVGFFGRIGFMLGIFSLFIYLVSIKVFNVPYLYPLLPFDHTKFMSLFFRTSAKKTI